MKIQPFLITFSFLLFSISAAFAQNTYVPDDNFEQALIDLGYDSGALNNSVPTDSVNSVAELNVSGKNISDLSGIEAFTALNELDFSYNQISTVDLSYNNNLLVLYCYNNLLTLLDLNANAIIETIYCGNNQLTELNLGLKASLIYLNCSGNQLTSLNLQNTTKIFDLICRYNNLTLLNLSANIFLTNLYCDHNNIVELDLSANPVLTKLDCSSNPITGLNVRNGNNINLQLTAKSTPDLFCIEVDDIATAQSKNWYKNRYTAYSENCSNHKLEMIFVPDDNFELELINMGLDPGPINDSVPAYGIKNTSNLFLNNKGIKDLTGIEAFESLTSLHCTNNQLTSIDVSSNLKLNGLSCDNNQIVELNLGQNTVLNSLSAYNNELTELNLQNGNNSNMNVNITNNPNLLCIQVDAPEATYFYSDWNKDAYAAYTEDCSNYKMEMTYVPDDNFEQALIDQNLDFDATLNDSVPTVAIKYLKSIKLRNNIKNLTGIQEFVFMESLDVNYNQLDALILTDNKELTELRCSNNNLSELKLGNHPKLTYIYCSDNKLTSLDLSKFISLKRLFCSANKLIDLDLSNHPVFYQLEAEHNELSGLNLKNGNNGNLSIDVRYNNDLLCIEVDDAQVAETYKNWQKDGISQYSEKCSNYKPEYTYLPDNNFEQYLIDWNYDNGSPNDSVITQVVQKIKHLNIFSRQISDLTGIKDFKQLEGLIIHSNPIGWFDLSYNKNLHSLDCRGCNLDSFDISGTVNLRNLSCSSNNLKTISLNKNENLENLSCQSNYLYDLDLSNNTKLSNIDCSYNSLIHINIQNGNNLNINSFDTRGNLPMCIEVDNIEFAGGSNWDKDEYSYYSINCDNHKLEEVYVPDDNFEEYLIKCKYDYGVPNDSVPLAKIISASQFSVGNKNIEDLTGIEFFTKLSQLNCSNNNIKQLDLSKNKLLRNLYCSNNQIQKLNIKENSNLLFFNCSNNNLTNLDFNLYTNLARLDCRNNDLITLEVPNMTNLIYLYSNDNSLSSVNMTGIKPIVIDFRNNPDLSCIQVDNEDQASNNSKWHKDEHTSYSENCSPQGPGISISEYNTLVDLYNSTNGENWINNIDWLDTTNASVSDWYGITVKNGHVVAIDLSNLNIEGDIFEIFSAFDSLTWLNLSGNNLSGKFPTFNGSKSSAINSVSENGYNLSYLNIANNNFIFSDLEPVADELLAIDTFIYAPQQLIGVAVDTSMYKYTNLTINIEEFSSGNSDSYTWFKNAELLNASDSVYLIENANLQDSGVYKLKVDNSVFPELTLESESYKLSVLVPVGINNFDINDFNMYPNPADKEVFIDTQNRVVKLKIMDIAGNVVYEHENFKTGRVNIEQYPKGIYLFRLEHRDLGVLNKKIVFK